MPTQIAVIYHSGYGHTAVQAQAVAEGAKSVPDTKVLLLTADEAATRWDDLAVSDALIFGAPTYMGSLSAPFKAFMDASSKAWEKHDWADKLAAGFTNSANLNGDKEMAVLQLAIFAAQHGMIWVSPNVKPAGLTPKDVNRLGGYLGALAQSDFDKGPDLTPPEGDKATAAHLGKRVATLAHRWRKSRTA